MIGSDFNEPRSEAPHGDAAEDASASAADGAAAAPDAGPGPLPCVPAAAQAGLIGECKLLV